MVERVYYRLRHLLVSSAVLLIAVLPAIAAKEVDFAHRSLLAGKVLLTVDYSGKWLDAMKTEFWHRKIE